MTPEINEVYVLKNKFDVYNADDIYTCYSNTGRQLRKYQEVIVVNRWESKIVFWVLDTDYLCWTYNRLFDNNFEKQETK